MVLFYILVSQVTSVFLCCVHSGMLLKLQVKLHFFRLSYALYCFLLMLNTFILEIGHANVLLTL